MKLDKKTDEWLTDQSIIHDFDPEPIRKVIEFRPRIWLLYVLCYGPLLALWAVCMWLIWR